MALSNSNEIRFHEQSTQIRAAIGRLDFSVLADINELDPTLSCYLRFYGFATEELSRLATYRPGLLHYEGLKLVAHWWQVNPAAPTVVLAHGLFDHVGIFLKMVKLLLEQGCSVFTLDFPGHGLSEGANGEIEHFSAYAGVLDQAVNRILRERADTQLIMIGQSTGGAAVACYLMEGKEKSRVDRAVLLAPLLRPKSWWYVNYGWIIAHRWIRHVPRRFTTNSNDELFMEFLKNKDSLQSNKISLKWVGAMREWVSRFQRFSVCQTPVLIIQGDADATVDWEYNIPIFQKKFTNNETVILPGARHHLANESNEYLGRIRSQIAGFLGTAGR